MFIGHVGDVLPEPNSETQAHMCPMPTRAMTHEFLADLAHLEPGKPEIAPFSQLGRAGCPSLQYNI